VDPDFDVDGYFIDAGTDVVMTLNIVARPSIIRLGNSWKYVLCFIFASNFVVVYIDWQHFRVGALGAYRGRQKRPQCLEREYEATL